MAIEEEELVGEELLKQAREKDILGYAVCSPPKDQFTVINQTAPMGDGTIMYFKFVIRLPKWHLRVRKAEEYLTVTPAYGELYAKTIAKKRELEAAIKTGLASAAQAVADYELLKHDERKYREILDYFKEGFKDEHVLRALYVDRIDAYTGEGYSMITMTKRWPTIITDFIRMYELTEAEANDIKRIREKLKVSEAEATVLKTKSRLFKEWKKIFFPDIRARYARIKNLVEARRKSVDEYREWLKPYIEMHKRMKEKTVIEPHRFVTHPLVLAFKPSGEYRRKLWVWKAFTPEEVGKAALVEKEIDPYDDFVKKWKEKIEAKYNVTITDEMVRKWIKEEFTVLDRSTGDRDMDPARYYYIFYDMDIWSLFLAPEHAPGFERQGGTDDQYFEIQAYVISQNVLLVFLLELKAKEMVFDRYVKGLIGVREVEEEIREEVEKEYKEVEEKLKRFQSIRNFFDRIRKFNEKTRRFGERVKRIVMPGARVWPLRYFIRPGPYEYVLYKRITKVYSRYMGGRLTKPMFDFIIDWLFKLSKQKA